MVLNTVSTRKIKAKKSIFASLKVFPNKEVHFMAEAKPASHRKFYVSDDERKSLIHEVGDSGFLLYEYYLMLAGVGSKKEISDEDAIEYFGWTPTRAKTARKKLTNAGWFYQESFAYSGGRKGITYYLGKKQVAARNSDQTRLPDSLYGTTALGSPEAE